MVDNTAQVPSFPGEDIELLGGENTEFLGKEHEVGIKSKKTREGVSSGDQLPP